VSSPFIPLVLLLGLAAQAEAPSAPGNDTITERDLRADLFFLAGDGFRGRLTATPQNELASDFIIARFERLGLKTVGPLGSYSQRFQLATATLGEPSTLSLVQNTNLSPAFQSGFDFTPARYSASAEAGGRLAFAGFGIVDRARGFDDYKNLDVEGCVVMILDHEPGENDPDSPFDGLVTSEAATPWRKVLAAQQRGAYGVLFVDDVHNHPEPSNFEASARSLWPATPPRIDRYLLPDWVDQVRIPVFLVSRSAADAILRLSDPKRRLEALARASEKSGASGFVCDDLGLSMKADVRRHVVADRNILAAIEGADPKLKDEWVIVSCHHDHNGAEGSQIFNGADDNGSGTVAVLEIAEAYAEAARQGRRPKRSVLFAAFNSEERGLLGSWAFVERPPVPLKSIAGVLNMDMIGRDEEVPEGGGSRFRGLPVQSAESNRNSVNLLGYSRTPSLARVVESANAPFGLALKQVLDNNASNLLRRSDQWPFLERGVPALFVHTGLHPDYHTPADRPEKIHYAKMERIARLVHQASWDLANNPDRPRLEAKAR
jgi:hypothetical protein